MKGVVTSIKHGANDSYTIITEEGRQAKPSGALALGLGEAVDMEGDSAVPGDAPSAAVLESCVSRLVSGIEGFLVEGPYRTGIGEIDGATSRMWGSMLAAARILLRKMAAGAPVIIRFHNDADGSGGAVGLHRGMEELGARAGIVPNLVWIMHRGVTYNERDAESDVLVANGYSSVEKPLLLIIDFGTSVQSNEGIAALRERFDVIWLDHHPLEKGFDGAGLPNYINPWMFGSDSGYTAGVLACAFSHAFSVADTVDMENASLVGDYSRFARDDGKGIKEAALLDLITSDVRIISRSDSNVTPSEIDGVVNDSARMEELCNYASMRLEETLDAAFMHMKKTSSGLGDVFVLDFSELRSPDTKYPLPGRFSSKLLERVEKTGGRPAVVMVHFNSYISVRVGEKLGDKVGLQDIIAMLKESDKEDVESGGGHKNAGSVKISQGGDKKAVLRELVDTVKGRLAGGA